jgi:hypothetical protein
MVLWLAALIFILSIADDVLCVLFVRRVNAPDKKFQAGLLSGLLTALISMEVLIYTTDWCYVPFNAAGSAIGTPIAIWADSKWPAKKARDEKGKFKKPVITSDTVIGVERGT